MLRNIGETGEDADPMLQSCDICGGRLTVYFHEVPDPITGEVFSICRCSECGLGHTIPRPDNLTPYYDHGYYGNRHSITAHYCIRRRLKFVGKAFDEANGRKLLDIGCGDGSFLLAARDAGWKVTGIEINPGLARDAGLDVRDNIEQVADCGLFDCVTMWHSLEHFRSVRIVLNQISNLLKPKGKLIIAVPDNGGMQAGFFRQKWLHLDVPRHLYHFDAKSLYTSLKSCSFTIESQWHQELEYDLMGWCQSALNSLFPFPNLFLDCLMGRQKQFPLRVIMANYLAGSILTALSLPAVATGTLFKQGGTLIVVANSPLPPLGAG